MAEHALPLSTRIPRISALGLAAGLCMAGLAGEAGASCKKGICVHGHDEDGTHFVYITSSAGNVTHYNVRYPDGRQFEVSADDTRFSFPVRDGRTYTYSVQACISEGVLQGSACAKWVVFTHSVNGGD